MCLIQKLYNDISDIHKRFPADCDKLTSEERAKLAPDNIRDLILNKAIGRLACVFCSQQAQAQLALETCDPNLQETWQNFKQHVQQLSPERRGKLQETIDNIEQDVLQNKQRFVEKLCEKYPDIMKGGGINQIGEDQMNPLARAILQKDINMVKVLIRLGADVSAADIYGRSALTLAVEEGNLTVVKVLLEAGANVSAVDNNGQSALMYAIDYGHTEIVKALLEVDPNVVSLVDNNGRSALMSASSKGYVEIVKDLLKILLEVDPNVVSFVDKKDKNGQSALMSAAGKGHLKIVETLLEVGADILSINNNKCSALTLAAENGHSEIVEALLEAGADISPADISVVKAVDKNGKSALMFAAANGHEKVVKALLAVGADIKAVDKNGKSALIFAAANGHEKVVKALLEINPNVVSFVDNNKQSALMFAAANGHENVVKALLEIDPNVVSFVDKNGNSALTFAAAKGHEKVVKDLLEINPNVVSFVDKNGNSALMFAATNGHEKVVEALLAVANDNIINVISAVNTKDQSALMLAVLEGHIKIIETILLKADYNAGFADIHKALAYAIQNNQTKIISILQARGASVEIAKKILEIQLSASIWGLKGKLTIDEMGMEITFALEGGIQSYTLSKLLEYVLQFYEMDLSKLTKNSSELKLLIDKKIEIQTSIANALSASSNIPPDIIDKIQTGKSFQPLALLGGFRGHSVSMVICHTEKGTEVMVCNRGEGGVPVPTQDPNKNSHEVLVNRYSFRKVSDENNEMIINEEIIKRLTTICDNMKEFNAMISEILEPLPDDVERLVQKEQKVGNCVWASLKGIIAILLWRAAIAIELGEPSGASGVELGKPSGASGVELAKNADKIFTTWTRKEILKKILESNPNQLLILKIIKKYIKKFIMDNKDRELMLKLLKDIRSSETPSQKRINAIVTLQSMLEGKKHEKTDVQEISKLLKDWLQGQSQIPNAA